MSRNYRNEKPFLFLKNLSGQSQSATHERVRKNAKSGHLLHNRIGFSLADTLSQKLTPSLNL